MSEWIDVVIYAALIASVWGWLASANWRLTLPMIADRNPEWLASHPELVQRLRKSRWFRWSCFLWGTLSLALLLALQTGLWPQSLAFGGATPKWEALKDLNSILFITGFVYVICCSALFFRWLDTNVPLASRRQATLERRSIDDYVPRAVRYAVYSAVVLHLAAWVAVGVAGRYDTSAFWGGVAFQFAVSGVFLVFAAIAVRRRPGAMDRVLGPDYRRTEVRIAFVLQLLPLLNGAARLYGHVGGVPPEHVDRLSHLGVVLVVVALATVMTAWSRRMGDSGLTPMPA